MAEHVALLDFGSNAVRFVHARLSRRGTELLREGRVRARLASGPHGSLSLLAIEQTLRAAERFLRSVRKYEPRLMAVGTASVRDAPNAQALLERLHEVGISHLRILSGIEEATLGAESALRNTRLRNGAVIDLGGGSLQWTTVRNRELEHALSLPLGAARMTREFLRHDPPAPHEIARLQAAVQAQLAQALPTLRAKGQLIVLGGTARGAASSFIGSMSFSQ